MASRVVENSDDLASLITLLQHWGYPFTVNIRKGKLRTPKQNKLQRKWLNEAAEQLQDNTAEGHRAYCKLHFGVPILRAEFEMFCIQYDATIRDLTYEQKISIMREPIDFPVTRIMTTKQKKKYLDAMWDHFTGLGVKLTDPSEI